MKRNWHLPVLVVLLILCGGFVDAGAVARAQYVVRKGDVMSRLFGAGYRKVAAASGIKDPNRIKVGQKLTIPDGVRFRKETASSGKYGFALKTINGDFRWKSGRDKLSAFPSKGSSAIRLLMPDLSAVEAKVLWDRLCAVPTNGRFEKGENGVLSAVLDDSTKTRLDLSNGMMIGGRKAIRFTGNLKLAKGDALKTDHLSAIRVGDRWLIRPEVCGNLLPGRGGERPPVVEPPVVPSVPPAAPPSISVFPNKEGCNAEYELIVGAGVWQNDLANGSFQFGEGMISCQVGNGYSAGVGFYGYHGEGENGEGYSWEEGGIGPQVGVKRNFLKSHLDEFGQEVLYPAGWQLKFRYLPNDYVEGGSDSYHVKQWGHKYGLYGEYWQRESENRIVGVTGEYWWYDPTRFTSSWCGDSPQDRGTWKLGVYDQRRLNDRWQLRLGASYLHQNWDKVNFLQLTPEFRLDETLMLTPWVSIPLINDVNHAGPTKGFTVRLEVWGKFRKDFEKRSEQSVVELGKVGESTDEKPADPETVVAAPEKEAESPAESVETPEAVDIYQGQ
ncbi:MAG: LysM peptidoglycan-binding domain-containing protein [Candidatus Moranbacteria bacterium]|nr:LysM peptidoglycan-binding domain-containing protein [Candidatus Moranbacteria bacterium]